MEIDIDLSGISGNNPWQVAWLFLANGGWLVFVVVFIWGLIQFWLIRQRSRYFNRWEWVMLSIYVPKVNEQTPRAVEYIFTSLAGTWKRIDWIERWITGKVQVNFSFELISRAGSIEYLIRAPRHYRDLVEAAIYAQYPDAEISEVTDYAERFVGVHWPDNDQGWDIWGTEFSQIKKYYFPIKTWPELFEADKTTVKDPLSSVLEIMSKLRKGEEFWFQLVITPISDSWKEKGKAFVRHQLGQESNEGEGIIDGVRKVILDFIDAIIYSVIAKPEIEVTENKKELLAKESEAIENIQNKISKVGFRTNMRAIYIARKEIFNKNKIKEGFLGALHQYTDLHANGFVQDKYTKVSTSHLYYFPKYRVEHFRKNGILGGYKERATRAGAEWGAGFILNVEELASIWHFPLGDTKALVIKKAEFKKAEAPYFLPIETIDDGLNEESFSGDSTVSDEPDLVSIEEEQGPPDNLPVG